MPVREKKRETTAGLFVLIGLLFLGVLIVEFGRFGDRFTDHYQLYVEFPDTAGIIKNSDVRLRGAKIGRVADHPELTTGKASSSVRMELLIRDEVKIPLDSTFQIGSSGLLGDKFIEIIPPDKETGEYYQSGDTIMGAGAGGFDSIKNDAQSIAHNANQLIKDAKVTFDKIDVALDSIKSIGDSMDVTMTKLNDEFLSKENLGNFNEAMANFKAASVDINAASKELQPAIVEAKKAMTSINKVATSADDLVASTHQEIKQIDLALRGIPKAVDSIDRAATEIGDTMAALKDGNSVIGSLAYDKKTGHDAKEFVKNLKRYGILRYRDDASKEKNDPRNKFRGSRR